jgi:hypothetical protein
MDFDELFESKKKYHGKNMSYHYNDEKESLHNEHNSNRKKSGNINFIDILKCTGNNKMYKFYSFLIIFLVLILILILIIVAFPLIAKLFNYISENGLQGIIKEITVFLENLWKGSK